MNILKIDYNEIYNKFWYQTYYKNNKIIFLMSQETLNFLNDQNPIYFINKNKYQKLFSHNIAIANWLSYGEIKISKEYE